MFNFCGILFLNKFWYVITSFICTSFILATPLNYSCDSSSYELAEGLAHCWSELKKDWLINKEPIDLVVDE